MEKEIERLKCSQCGKNAAYNTPCIDVEGKVWCDPCADDSVGIELIGISQHLSDSGFVQLEKHAMHYTFSGCIMSIHMNRCGVKPSISVWTHKGNRAVPLREGEEKMAMFYPFEFLKSISIEVEHGNTWCTGCGKLIKEKDVAGFPLFAGVSCKSCWVEHLEALNDQKKRGDVCRMCGEPRGNCCC